jgi:malic enzyme
MMLEQHVLCTRALPAADSALLPHLLQEDLSVAYSPGVAEPCVAIQQNERWAYEYTAKGHLVGVITNGTAVLGLGAWPAQEEHHMAGLCLLLLHALLACCVSMAA